MKGWTKKIIEAIWGVIKELPGWLLAIAKTPTGKRLLIAAVSAGLAAIGINAPFETIKEIVEAIFSAVGSDLQVSTTAVAIGTTLLPLLEGTIRANDTLSDLKRQKTGILSSYTITDADSDANKVLMTPDGAKPIDRYEIHVKDGLRAISKDGKMYPVNETPRWNSQLELYKQLKSKAYEKRI